MTTTTATPTVPTTVYLNEAPASFLGFNRAAPARLRAAATFNLPIPTDTRPQQTAISAALAAAARERGVEIRLETPVREIAVENGRAAGVVLASGETVRARAVAAAVPPKLLFSRMVPAGAVTQEMIDEAAVGVFAIARAWKDRLQDVAGHRQRVPGEVTCQAGVVALEARRS